MSKINNFKIIINDNNFKLLEEILQKLNNYDSYCNYYFKVTTIISTVILQFLSGKLLFLFVCLIHIKVNNCWVTWICIFTCSIMTSYARCTLACNFTWHFVSPPNKRQLSEVNKRFEVGNIIWISELNLIF